MISYVGVIPGFFRRLRRPIMNRTPFARREERSGRKSYHLPARYCRVQGSINIERVGPLAKKNDYRCGEEGCSWHKEGISNDTARLHAKSHSETKKCHIFEQHVSVEQLAAQQREKRRAASKRYRDRQKQGVVEPVKKPRTASQRGPGGRDGQTERQEQQQQQEEEEDEGFEPDGVYVPTWLSEDAGELTAVVAVTRPGQGAWVMPGRYSAETLESTEVAVSWAASQAAPLCRWLGDSKKRGARHRSVLWHAGRQQISLYRTSSHDLLIGQSVAVGIALSLVCMLVKRNTKPTVAVTGNLDLRGNVLEVGGLQAKLRACQAREGIETLLVPEASLAQLSIASLPADLRDYARRVLRGVRTMVDVIRLAFPDCPPLPAIMVTPLGLVPPAVGLGYGLRFPDPKSSGMQDEVASERLVFEAVSRPGTGRLIFTGSGDEELQLMAHAAMEWAMANCDVIAEDLGARRGPAMLARTRDVHVNVVSFTACSPAVARQYSTAMAVAIASLASGRLPQPHVAVLGKLGPADNFYPSPTVVTQPRHVQALVRQGFQQLVVPTRGAVAQDMVGVLEEQGVELWMDEDPLATFSSALLNVFGLASEDTTTSSSSSSSSSSTEGC